MTFKETYNHTNIEYNFDVINDFVSLPGVGISVPPPVAAAVQPAQQAPTAQAAPQPAQTANMQPQATPQHHQLLMKQQQASAFLSPQSNQQVGILKIKNGNTV